MKRLTLTYRKFDGTRTRAYRINIPEPVENINVAELEQDLQMLKTLHVVPEGFDPDEVRITETNTQVLINLIE
ncbi:MAG: DUF2922 family protein [Fervidobacterium sp.]|jgi:hypothetical protein